LLEPALRLLPAEVPRPAAITLDSTVAMITLALAALAGLGIGIIAAWRGAGKDPARQLRSTTAGATQSVERLRLQRVLVATQLALSLILLAGAGLLLRSFREVLQVDPGYRTERTLTAMVSLPSVRYSSQQIPEWYLSLPARLTQVPGVLEASAVSSLPLAGGEGRGDLTIEGQSFGPGLSPAATYRRVLPNYFRTMAIPLLRGREFTDRDRGAGEMVVIVGRSLAQRYWPDQDPIGYRIKVGPPEGEPWLTVVGVVGDVRHSDLESEPSLDTYEPHAQRPRATMGIVVHTATDPATLGPTLRGALRAEDPELPVWDIQTLPERVGTSVASRRFTTGVIAGFGAMALLLAAVGVYGVTAYGVGRRQREFAIRLALGARPERVRGQVLRESLRVAAIGVLVGLPAALLLSRLIASLLYDVSPTDPAVFGFTVLLLAFTTIAATWLPARRATAVDPAVTLRE
jgi:putative ABC transport system permease protein